MIRFPLTLLLTAALLAPTSSFAQDAKSAPLPAWDQLTPAQRELLIAPLRDRWNREPDQRERLIEYAKRWKTMPPPQREHARRGMQRWDRMSPEQRQHARALFHATRGMGKDERHAFFENWRKLSPQQRSDWFKAHPAPDRDDPMPPPPEH